MELGLVKMKWFIYVTGVSLANTVEMEKVKIQVWMNVEWSELELQQAG